MQLQTSGYSAAKADDLQGVEQITSSDWINQEHVLVIEDFEACVAEDVDFFEGTKYTLTHQLYKIFEAKLIKSTPWDLVHSKPLEYCQGKVEITGVMTGTYIAWSIFSTKEKPQGKSTFKW